MTHILTATLAVSLFLLIAISFGLETWLELILPGSGALVPNVYVLLGIMTVCGIGLSFFGRRNE